MSNIITSADFDGLLEVKTTSFSQGVFDTVITEQEEDYLTKLLGRDLYNLFVADLVSGVPQSARFIVIYNYLVLDYNGKEYISKGMKKMLEGFIYFEYVRTLFSRQTTTGVKRTKSENSSNLQTTSFDTYSKYNNSVDYANVIQQYICDNESDYPEYKGSPFKYVINL